jgi:hypothetical protein
MTVLRKVWEMKRMLKNKKSIMNYIEEESIRGQKVNGNSYDEDLEYLAEGCK